MKHYFFVNPVAGKGNQSKELIEEIKVALKDTKSESVIIMTEPNRGSEAKVSKGYCRGAKWRACKVLCLWRRWDS